MCIQIEAMRGALKAQQDWAISFSWCGKTRSMPPPWISKVFFVGSSQLSPPPKGSSSFAIDMAEHSICQPGRPLPAMPAGDGQPGSLSAEGFHSTKSVASRL